MKNSVSIIIVTYNKFSLLKNCLESLYKFCADLVLEVIIIDNNSSEIGQQEIINKYPKTILIKNGCNLGFAAANNQGFEIAKGDYVVCLNNDTILTEDIITPLISELEKADKHTIVGCQLLNEDKTNQESYHKFPSLWNVFCEYFFLYKLFPKNERFSPYFYNHNPDKSFIEVDVLKGAFFIAKKETIQKLKGFDERFFFYTEETDLFYRLKKELNGKTRFYPGHTLIHIGGGTVESMPWFKYKNLVKSKIQFFQKHYSGIYFLSNLMILYLGIGIRIPLYLFGGLLMFNKKLIKKSWLYLRQLTIYPKNEFE